MEERTIISSAEKIDKEKTPFLTIMRKAKKVWIVIFVLILWVLAMQYVVADKYAVVVNVVGESSEASAVAMADGLDFGSVPQGSSATRFVTLHNGSDHDIYVKVLELGEAARFIQSNRNGFVLGAGEGENLEFTADIPAGAKEKKYTGKIMIFEVPKLF